MTELDDWLREQTSRERRVVRLEDALLSDRYGPYFFHRLRFFMARTAVGALLHGIRILLLVSAFAVDEFLAFIVLTSLVAVVADAWWGALESMRSRIRQMQRTGTRYRAPSEIGAWLRLSVWLCAVGLGAAVVLLVAGAALGGELTPILVMSTAVLVGMALNFVTRAYHSGAYAVRRVYRPLPSLLAADVVSLAVTLALWPILDLWAFALAEVATVAVLVGTSLWYTTRTYRSLAFPTLPSLLRRADAIPRRPALRAAVAPAAAFGVVGLEALVLIAVLLAGGAESSALLVALLAALSPVIRAGFEWARLLYFDMARLEVPLLGAMRRRFERAVAYLSIVVGVVTWVTSAVVAVLILGVRDPALVAALLPFLVARSVLAAAQMRAFTWRAYLRLALTGLVVMAMFLILVATVESPVARLVGLAVALAVGAVALLALPERPPAGEPVVPPGRWLEQLRRIDRPVTVHQVRLDGRDTVAGVSPEQRRKAAWIRTAVGTRLGRRAKARRGLATWIEPRVLAWFVPGRATDDSPPEELDLLGGLAVSRPSVAAFEDGRRAAQAMAPAGDPGWTDDPGSMLRLFESWFPTGIVFDVLAPATPALASLSSVERADVLGAALRHVQGVRPHRSRGDFDVTSSADASGLRMIFLIPSGESRSARRRWRRALDVHNRRVAAGLVPAAEDAPEAQRLPLAG